MPAAMKAAASACRLPLVKYLRQERNATCDAFEAILGGRLDTIKYLRASGGLVSMSRVHSVQVLGRSDMLAYWLETSKWYPLDALRYGFLADAKLLATNDVEIDGSGWSRICSIGDVRFVQLAIQRNAIPERIVYYEHAVTSLPILRYLLATVPPKDPAKLLSTLRPWAIFRRFATSSTNSPQHVRSMSWTERRDVDIWILCNFCIKTRVVLVVRQ
ncbi:Aste57867_9999 [Aphanomyces stellatus]|uniref:Aste57867_9999 protein n=1 Tax=Aphanomyces stellatus TaxID=120398 RepID=A0A485KP91_9STRA|nr:hypothetical protein As57867_009960 [Aphanomyces stellatus]VFT86877.1 Aste57867_9999 [Aphanomyces stellatus]